MSDKATLILDSESPTDDPRLRLVGLSEVDAVKCDEWQIDDPSILQGIKEGWIILPKDLQKGRGRKIERHVSNIPTEEVIREDRQD